MITFKDLEKFTYDDALSVCYPMDEKYYWDKHGLTVMFDGYLPDGTRVHIVEEDCFPEAVILDNAVVISKQESLVGEYEERL